MYLILGYPVLFIMDKVPLVYQQDHHIYSLLLRAKYLLIAMKGNELTMSLISKRVKQGERFVSNFFEKGYFVQKNDYFLQHEILNDDRWMAIWDYYCKWFQKFMVREFFCFVFCTTQRQVKLHVASFPVAYFSTLSLLRSLTSSWVIDMWSELPTSPFTMNLFTRKLELIFVPMHCENFQFAFMLSRCQSEDCSKKSFSENQLKQFSAIRQFESGHSGPLDSIYARQAPSVQPQKFKPSYTQH